MDVSKRWYLKQPTSFQNKWKTSGPQFSSFRQRYIRILDIALPSELAIIGKSYVHAYNMSSDVHFTPQDISSDFNPDDVYIGIDRVGLLCYATVIRCQHLLGIVPEGINTTIRNLHDENTEPARLIAGLKQEVADVGDFVWAHVNFLNLTTDDPNDTGIAGVDIFKMDADGKAIEHWDVLQVVGTPNNAVPWFAPNIPSANSNGMF